MSEHPYLGIVNAEGHSAVQAFAAGLQKGHHQRDAEVLNRQFAADVVWGSPFGALIGGYEQLHSIHVDFQQLSKMGTAYRYQVRHVLAVRDDGVA